MPASGAADQQAAGNGGQALGNGAVLDEEPDEDAEPEADDGGDAPGEVVLAAEVVAPVLAELADAPDPSVVVDVTLPDADERDALTDPLEAEPLVGAVMVGVGASVGGTVGQLYRATSIGVIVGVASAPDPEPEEDVEVAPAAAPELAPEPTVVDEDPVTVAVSLVPAEPGDALMTAASWSVGGAEPRWAAAGDAGSVCTDAGTVGPTGGAVGPAGAAVGATGDTAGAAVGAVDDGAGVTPGGVEEPLAGADAVAAEAGVGGQVGSAATVERPAAPTASEIPTATMPRTTVTTKSTAPHSRRHSRRLTPRTPWWRGERACSARRRG